MIKIIPQAQWIKSFNNWSKLNDHIYFAILIINNKQNPSSLTVEIVD